MVHGRGKRRWLFGGLAIVTVVGLAVAWGLGGDDEVRARDAHTYRTALDAHTAVVYKSPSCVCCDAYIELLREAGVEVEVVATDAMAAVKADHGVPLAASSCHTMVIDGYVVEGHVPLNAVGELVTTRPDIDGITVPGMPPGSPGMPGEVRPLPVMALVDGTAEPFWDAR